MHNFGGKDVKLYLEKDIKISISSPLTEYYIEYLGLHLYMKTRPYLNFNATRCLIFKDKVQRNWGRFNVGMPSYFKKVF